jgi:hypothetical protein
MGLVLPFVQQLEHDAMVDDSTIISWEVRVQNVMLLRDVLTFVLLFGVEYLD